MPISIRASAQAVRLLLIIVARRPLIAVLEGYQPPYSPHLGDTRLALMCFAVVFFVVMWNTQSMMLRMMVRVHEGVVAGDNRAGS